jgi:hypothetical protein
MPITAIRSRNAVESLRDVVQDSRVPELKALKRKWSHKGVGLPSSLSHSGASSESSSKLFELK